MKKLLTLIILNLFLNSLAFAKTKNFQCVKLLHYMDENEKLIAFLGDEVGSLILEFISSGALEQAIDQWGSVSYGKATFVYNEKKHEFNLNVQGGDRLGGTYAEGIYYNRIDKKYAKEDFNKDLKLKDKEGRLVKLKFIKFEPNFENKKFHNLTITETYGLHTLESHRNKAEIVVDNFVCN
jgi:hypothetical protein